MSEIFPDTSPLAIMSVPRNKRQNLERWLSATHLPVYVIAADRRLVYFNSGCEALMGWTAEDVLGEVCHYASTSANTSESVTGSLCPPPEVFTGQMLQVPLTITSRQGAILTRLAHFFPLRGEAEEITGVMAVLSPIPLVTNSPPVNPVLRLHAELAALRSKLRTRFSEQNLVADSPVMARVLNQIDLARQTNSGVYLHGEAGTGKEHLARVIHYAGPQKAQWFVPLECGQLGEDELQRVLHRLIEVHLSPHEGGRLQPGVLYLADVERLPRDLQQQLVEVVQSGCGGVGGALRLLAGSKVSPREAVKEGLLRDDLEAILSTIVVELPPLRARGSDIPLLTQHFIEDWNRKHEKQLTGVAEEVWPLLDGYDWPGNLDELQQISRDACAHATEPRIQPEDLSFRIRTALRSREELPSQAPRALPLDEMLTRVEHQAILLALERGRYNKTTAAEMLGINRARLYRRMEQLGIADREDPANHAATSE